MCTVYSPEQRTVDIAVYNGGQEWTLCCVLLLCVAVPWLAGTGNTDTQLW